MDPGGLANGTVPPAAGAIVNGGIGINGPGVAATARAWFQLQGHGGSTGNTEVFRDEAHGEEVFDDPGFTRPSHPLYDQGMREAHALTVIGGEMKLIT